jgi:hypothetical protein
MKRMAPLLLFVALTACPGRTPPVKTITVQVPVVQPCIEQAQIPVKPAWRPLPDDPIAALAVATDWLLDWSVYWTTADPLLKACATVK